jgi:hypothetical protein
MRNLKKDMYAYSGGIEGEIDFPERQLEDLGTK